MHGYINGNVFQSGYNYVDMFKVTWDAFTDQELHAIRDFDGKKVQSLTNFMTIFKSVTVLVFKV